MQLPEPIQAYFDADHDLGGAAPMGTFTHDAVVKDEGKTYVGHDSIDAWWSAAKARYQHTVEPCEILREGHTTIVRSRVTGRFPGSPALLTFIFQLRDGQISALEIGA